MCWQTAGSKLWITLDVSATGCQCVSIVCVLGSTYTPASVMNRAAIRWWLSAALLLACTLTAHKATSSKTTASVPVAHNTSAQSDVSAAQNGSETLHQLQFSQGNELSNGSHQSNGTNRVSEGHDNSDTLQPPHNSPAKTELSKQLTERNELLPKVNNNTFSQSGCLFLNGSYRNSTEDCRKLFLSLEAKTNEKSKEINESPKTEKATKNGLNKENIQNIKTDLSNEMGAILDTLDSDGKNSSENLFDKSHIDRHGTKNSSGDVSVQKASKENIEIESINKTEKSQVKDQSSVLPTEKVNQSSIDKGVFHMVEDPSKWRIPGENTKDKHASNGTNVFNKENSNHPLHEVESAENAKEYSSQTSPRNISDVNEVLHPSTAHNQSGNVRPNTDHEEDSVTSTSTESVIDSQTHEVDGGIKHQNSQTLFESKETAIASSPLPEESSEHDINSADLQSNEYESDSEEYFYDSDESDLEEYEYYYDDEDDDSNDDDGDDDDDDDNDGEDSIEESQELDSQEVNETPKDSDSSIDTQSEELDAGNDAQKPSETQANSPLRNNDKEKADSESSDDSTSPDDISLQNSFIPGDTFLHSEDSTGDEYHDLHDGITTETDETSQHPHHRLIKPTLPDFVRKRVYPPHAIHGLIWEDRRYLLSVLIPVGCGIAGALVIVCLAYAARSCQLMPTRKIKQPPILPQDLAYMDRVMLLADSSDEDI